MPIPGAGCAKPLNPPHYCHVRSEKRCVDFGFCRVLASNLSLSRSFYDDPAGPVYVQSRGVPTLCVGAGMKAVANRPLSDFILSNRDIGKSI